MTICNIKGNVRSGEKIYHLPSCRDYANVIIDTAFGDIWFCSQNDAIDAGFRKAGNC